MLLWNQGRTIAKTVDQGKIQGLPLLCPIRLHCCTNYNAPTGALDSKAAQTLLEIFTRINKSMQATILMVTHDAFSASYCDRILFLKDGKIFNELVKGDKSRRDFLNEILDILALTGGDKDVK